MIELKHGVTDDLVDMVYDRLHEHRSYIELVDKLGKKGIRDQLENMEWVVSVYKDKVCVAGLWGAGEINLVTRKGYEKSWISRPALRKFWDWFFSKNDKAVVTPDNGLVIPFLLRLGFGWEDGKLVLYRRNLKVA